MLVKNYLSDNIKFHLKLLKRNWLKQSQNKLAYIYYDLMSRVWKEEKKAKMKKKKKKERPFGQWVRKEAQRKWGLIQSWRTEWVRVSRREEKNRESKRKLWEIYSEEESVKKKSFFFVQVVFLSVVISI